MTAPLKAFGHAGGVLLGIATMMVMQGCGDDYENPSKCPANHDQSMCMKDSMYSAWTPGVQAVWEPDEWCCEIGLSAACDRSKGYIGFGWGSPDYQVVCDSGTEDGVEWEAFHQCCLKEADWMKIVCPDKPDAVFDKDVCMEPYEGEMVANDDCQAQRGEGGCADGYTFSEGEQTYDFTLLGGKPIHATCCTPGNSTRMLAAGDLLA